MSTSQFCSNLFSYTQWKVKWYYHKILIRGEKYVCEMGRRCLWTLVPVTDDVCFHGRFPATNWLNLHPYVQEKMWLTSSTTWVMWFVASYRGCMRFGWIVQNMSTNGSSLMAGRCFFHSSAPGNCSCNFKSALFKLTSTTLNIPVKLPSGECNKTSLMKWC